MILLLVVSLVPYQVFGEPIVGGDESDIQKHPWLASIQKHGYHWCGGSIIANNLVLTAAHCVDNISPVSLKVRVGSSRTDSGGSMHDVVLTKSHRYYRTNPGPIRLTNDVAMLKVSPPFKFDSRVSVIKLAAQGHIVIPGTRVIGAGWGAQVIGGPAIYDLKSTHLLISNSSDCARAYGDETGTQMSSNNLICALQSGGDTCHGDSGGPIVDGDVQVGIVSWGSDCADSYYPGVYVDVGSYRVAIDATSKLMESEEPDRTFFKGAVEFIKSWFD